MLSNVFRRSHIAVGTADRRLPLLPRERAGAVHCGQAYCSCPPPLAIPQASLRQLPRAPARGPERARELAPRDLLLEAARQRPPGAHLM